MRSFGLGFSSILSTCVVALLACTGCSGDGNANPEETEDELGTGGESSVSLALPRSGSADCAQARGASAISAAAKKAKARMCLS